jgi:hypothetical protein
MADNLITQATAPASIPANTGIAVRSVIYSGDENQAIAPVGLVAFSGSDDAKTATDIPLVTFGSPGTVGLPVVLVANPNGGILETDDGSVASGQSDLTPVISLPYLYNGAAWVRGGWTPGKLISASGTNGTVIKSSAGVLGMLSLTNINAAARYAHLYDKATTPTVGTDVPKYTFLIPGNTAGAGSNVPLPKDGIAFASGIGIAFTTGAGDTDTGSVAAGDLIANYGTL